MSTASTLQAAIAEVLGTAGALRVAAPIVARKQKNLASEIAAATANHGLCVYVMQPLPTRAMGDMPFVVFEGAEVRVRIIEKPSVNGSGASAYDLFDDAAIALHWQPGAVDSPLAGILAHPLQLASRVLEKTEDKDYRVVDLLLEAVYQPASIVVTPAAFALVGNPFIDLQHALAEQLRANMPAEVKILTPTSHDLGSAIETAVGDHVLSVSVEPVVPTRAMQGVPFVFYEASQVTVRVSETPSLNDTGADAYDLIERVAQVLHWQALPEILAAPLRLERDCVRDAFDPKQPGKLKFELLFEASFGREAA